MIQIICHDDSNAWFGQRNNPNFVWPAQANLGNGFNYFVDMYATNVRTNFKTHCETRLKYFFRMRCYEMNLHDNENFDPIDIRNILKDMMKNEDWTDGNMDRMRKRDIFWQELIAVGFPANVCIKEYVKENWFHSTYGFIKIQREVETFLNEPQPIPNPNPEQPEPEQPEPEQPEQPEPEQPQNVLRFPTVKNFTVIPLCNHQLKHTRFDNTALI